MLLYLALPGGSNSILITTVSFRPTTQTHCSKRINANPLSKMGARRPPSAKLLIPRGGRRSINSDGSAKRDSLSPRIARIARLSRALLGIVSFTALGESTHYRR